MNSFDFLQQLNDVDEELLLSSLDALEQEDNMSKKFKKGGSALSKIILVATMVAGIIGVTAFAAESFPSIFGMLKREYAELATEYPSAQDDADLYKRAAEANEAFEAEYVPLPEYNDSQIIIGETFYDGKNFLIAYRIDEKMVPVRYGFGPDSEGFDRLWTRKANPDDVDRFEDYLAAGIDTQEQYESEIAFRNEQGLDFVEHKSNFWALIQLKGMASEEEFSAFVEKLKEEGYGGFTYRTIFISDHILVEGEDCLRPNKNGELWGEESTEYGDCIVCEVMDEILPEKYKNMDQLTLTLRVKAVDTTVFIDLENGACSFGDEAGVIEVPVTLTKTAPTE